ncbi:MAG: hypothetical protein C0432_05395 [Candidatus Puniceispirillum sp.]|nr:hypothetical protein [Candidatus Pelagibacter sp.]MBA4283709.1 hypothetical protein [Candidatus Puniceispirillum sp.]
MNQIKYKKRNFYLLLLTLFSKTEVYPSISPIGWDMTSHEIPKVKVPKVDHQIEEWRAIFSEHKEQALTVNDHCEGLRLKLDQVYSHVGSKLKSEPEKRDLLANFYTQDIKIYNSKQLNFQYFNAINLRLSFLIDPHLVSSLFTEYVFSNIDLRIDEEWKDIEKCKTFLLKYTFSNQYADSTMVAFIYNSTGGLAYRRFVETLACAEPIGLVSLPLNITNGPHADITQHPTLFLLHDVAHWKGYSIRRHTQLLHHPEYSMFERYGEIYKKAQDLPEYQRKIIEGSLFDILHENSDIYSFDSTQDLPEFFLSTTPEKLNSDGAISTEFKLHQTTIHAYEETVKELFPDPAKDLQNQFFSALLEKIQITDQGNKFKLLNSSELFELFLVCDDNISSGQYLFLPITLKYSAFKTEDITEFQHDFWLLTKAEIKENVFPEHMVRDGITYNDITYTCNQLIDIAKNIVDQINEYPEDIRTIQAYEEDFQYDIYVKDTVSLLEWVYDEIFPKNSKGQVSSEVIKSNIKRMYQDFYEISKKLLLENNT